MIGQPSSANAHDLLEDALELVREPRMFELEAPVGEHAAGHLVTVVERVVFHRRAERKAFAPGELSQIPADAVDL
jgi:hypothetical protein